MKSIALFLALLLAAGSATAAAGRPPNIVIIFTDDLAYGDIEPFGAEGYATPHLARMAADQKPLTVQITERALDFIDRNTHQPFFLYVAHPQPHVPLFVSEKFAGKTERGLFGDVIAEIDWSTGEILK